MKTKLYTQLIKGLCMFSYMLGFINVRMCVVYDFIATSRACNELYTALPQVCVCVYFRVLPPPLAVAAIVAAVVVAAAAIVAPVVVPVVTAAIEAAAGVVVVAAGLAVVVVAVQ